MAFIAPKPEGLGLRAINAMHMHPEEVHTEVSTMHPLYTILQQNTYY